MADITAAGVRERFPEFSALADGAINFAIEEAYGLTDVSELITYLATAHVLKIKELAVNGVGIPGELTENKIGPIRTIHKEQALTARQAFFTRTEYGRRMLALESRHIDAIVSVRIG